MSRPAGRERPPNSIRLTAAARGEFRNLPASQQDELVHVFDELRIPTGDNDPDEGSWQPKPGNPTLYHYRRGLTRKRRRQLDDAAARGEDLDSEQLSQNLWDYVVIYRQTTVDECIEYRCAPGLTVMRIWPIVKILSVLNLRDLSQL